MKNNFLVFTDLDGTLLDHNNYSHTAAQEALDRLATLDIPVILNSSKTPDELDYIARDLHITFPRIAENGSVISYPETGEQQVFGTTYATICEVLNKLRVEHGYCFEGFHDWPTERISDLTGLSLEAAARAGKRFASEPLLWNDDEALLANFREHLSIAKLSLKRGGRFWHVMGNADKVDAMLHLKRDYEERSEKKLVIALGDGPNDRDMLAEADIAVIINNPQGAAVALPENTKQRQIYTDLAGPEGWNVAINTLLNE